MPRTAKNKTKDYPYIRAWGKMMGSQMWYILDQIRRAQEENAPENAIYRHFAAPHEPEKDRGWATTADLGPETMAELQERLG